MDSKIVLFIICKQIKHYNSFNYIMENNQITLSQNKLVGYMDRENDYDKLLSDNKALND